MSTTRSPDGTGERARNAVGQTRPPAPGQRVRRRLYRASLAFAGVALVVAWQVDGPVAGDPTRAAGGMASRPLDAAYEPLYGEDVSEAVLEAEPERAEPGSIRTAALERNGVSVEVVDGVALVRAADEVGARAWLEARGARVVYSSATGYWRVAAPAGVPLSTFLSTLEQQVRSGALFTDVQPEGVIRAASLASGQTRHRGLQWNLDQIRWNDAWSSGAVELDDLSDVTVAVIDSGVAYKDQVVNGVPYIASTDLAGSDIHAGPDFIDGDSRPLDQNGHGTHIANIIAADGGTIGVAPHVSLMAIRVLNQQNVGQELSLVDAVNYAVDHGADIINLSLSFPSTYVPGAALAEAIQHAEDNDVLVLAASGNSGASQVSYPAAYADVLAVGASRLTRGSLNWVADYSNTGTGLDLVAPGGASTLDVNADGKPDGVVAQTITPGNPSELHYYLMAGTSQAVAHASGAAAWLRALGADSSEVRQALINTSVATWGRRSFSRQDGEGLLNLSAAVRAYTSGSNLVNEDSLYYVNVLPLMYSSGSNVGAIGLIQVVDKRGLPAKRVLLAGHWFGSSSSNFGVITNNQGQAWVSTTGTVSASAPAGFGLQVDRVLDGVSRVAPAPTSYYYMSEGLLYSLFSWYYLGGANGANLLFEATPNSRGLPSWVAPSYVAKSVGPVNSLVPTAITFNAAYLQGLSSTTFTPVSASFTRPLSFGWGSSSSLTARVGNVSFRNGSVQKLAIAPLDLAMFYGDLAVTALVLNTSSSTFEADNLAYLSGMSSSAMGRGLSTTIVGDGLSTTIVGDGLSTTIVGDGLSTTIVGDAIWGTIVGDSVYYSVAAEGLSTTIVGDGLSMTIVGDAIWGTIVGESEFIELLGNSAAVPEMVASSYTDGAGALPDPVDVVSIQGGDDTIIVTPDEP